MNEASIELHKKLKGKIEIGAKAPVKDIHDLSLVYTPGVGDVSRLIAEDKDQTDELTWRKNTVAIVTDGSAVLGLGNIGPEAALPVMEGKSVIFKQFSGIDAVPIVLGTQDTEEIIKTIEYLAPGFGAIQLEDISAPRCFEIEERLTDSLSIPVMHDDQHGTAIVIAAGLINALKLAGKQLADVRIILSGAGAAGLATTSLLHAMGATQMIVVDTQGCIYKGRDNLNSYKEAIAEFTNPEHEQGQLVDVIHDADVFIGICKAGILKQDMVKQMKSDPIIFALANPIPEIMPDEAREAGARIIATGRSDFPNQVNNACVYPGLFRGMLDFGVKTVTTEIKIRAAEAVADFVGEPTVDRFIPSLFEPGLHEAVRDSVKS